ncbi:hypothetical protein CR513_27584, partial [Mucuna pruriens]
MVNPSWNDWSQLLEDALWAHKIAYQTPLGMSPYQIIFNKAYNMAYDQVGKERKLQLSDTDGRRGGKHLADRADPPGRHTLRRISSSPYITSAHYKPKSKKTMVNLNLRGQRSFGIVLGVGSTSNLASWLDEVISAN